ncbi:MAG: amino acid carrier protein [Rickettsiaceae bacterium]|nr:amino acid carrier protein [Rickettsiaceae bacterium]
MSNIDNIFYYLEVVDNFFWGYIGFVAILISGLYLTIKSRGKQFRVLYNIAKVIRELQEESKNKDATGLHPLKLFFTSVGGMIGVGNIVGVGVAVMLGGPGSIFWMWIASIFGTLIKYSEIYLGIKYRVLSQDRKSYNGGMMYYLEATFKSKVLAKVSAILLCIYGVEILQFTVLVNRLESTFSIDRNLIITALLLSVIYSSIGGINRLATICTAVMPIFLILYALGCIYIICVNYQLMPGLMSNIFYAAFNGQAAVGGFVASSFVHTAYLGCSKAVYSGDIGIGYDSVVQSETKVVCPMKQSRLSILALTLDTLICSLSCIIIGVTGAWHNMSHLEPSEVVSKIFSLYFPYSDYFLTLVLFFSGFTTVIAFFTVGLKTASFVSSSYGKNFYFVFGVFCFIFFANFSEERAIIIMNITSVLLVTINIIAILKMRNEIEFYDTKTSKRNKRHTT